MKPSHQNSFTTITLLVIFAVLLFFCFKNCGNQPIPNHQNNPKIDSLKTQIATLKDSITYYHKLVLSKDTIQKRLLSSINDLRGKMVVYTNVIKIMPPDEACEFLAENLTCDTPKIVLIDYNNRNLALVTPNQIQEIDLKLMENGFLKQFNDTLQKAVEVSLIKENIMGIEMSVANRQISAMDSTIFEQQKEIDVTLDKLDRANLKVKKRTDLAKWGWLTAGLGWVAFVVK